ncbi:FAD dependent oxidoreductase [Macrophomina phaseolina MS6]|uniref:FAD dependent oxidoreductase n=1 Tax=Macrophomina phaseolina (strain MS6) TaxID=1126212 RepID=K2RYE7_MACPH|nr:FAD dependent oxidoreductase [Macrophomina phaseolina MS6]
MTTVQNPGLVFWRDLNPLPVPLQSPTASSPRILIIGGGVTGLTTAWTLLDRGYHVTILAKEWASYGKAQRLTSQIAGALWEFPPAVCGQHTDAISLRHSKRWCMVAYHIWDAIAASKPLSQLSGVRMKAADFFFPTPVEQDAEQLSKMHEIMASGVRGFRRDPNIIEERRIGESYGAVDAYEHLAPVIDTDVAMAFLKDLVVAKGAELVTGTIHGDIFDQEHSLRQEFQADVIINATGLAGTELAGDSSCYPIRGGLIRVINDGSDFPKVEQALTISADAAHDSNEIVFLVPRNDDILLIGGIAEPHKYELDLSLETPIIKRMRARCEAFLPDLKKARLDPDYPLAQGLRPFRQRNVRVERELRLHGTGAPSRIVHSYGQGGAGWSLSFGCAGDVAALVEEALLDLPPRSMALEPEQRAVEDLPARTLHKEDSIKAHL